MPVSVLISNLDPALDVTCTLAAFEDERFVLLFDSAAQHRERDARYTILTADPVAVTQLDTAVLGDDPFDVLRAWQKRLPPLADEVRETLPPFCGGIAGLLSYELGQAFERIPNPAIDDFKTPALLVGLFDWAIVWDHIACTVRRYVLQLQDVPSPQPTVTHPDRAAWIDDRLQREVDHNPTSVAAAVLNSQSITIAERHHRIEPGSEIYSDFTRDQYTTSVARVVEYIRAGDIFQANLSQRLLSPWSGTATQLYASIRTNNPAPFCGLLKADDFSIVSASPERFLKVDRSRQVETRPIKGTRRRPRSPIADLYAGAELSTSEKDRAENVMIVDLLRNDISRSCQPGTVRVTGLCEVERFETVLHLVSTVVGTLRDDCDVWDLMAGCFPGGSITGAPKIRAMEIIAEMEPTVRGAYCGCLFFLGPCGNFDSSILIRTFTLKHGWVQFPVGGGIVADSDPLDEYRETLHKASGMIRSLRAPGSEGDRPVV
ncbi:MAG: aminodeoxychorismate synthase component I [Planctomycetota bacterium]|nr:MAG: aminodeoxychorismate synthase component I [Planctomycetota bacterium]